MRDETPEEKRIRKRDELIVRANSQFGMGGRREVGILFGMHENSIELSEFLHQPGFPRPYAPSGKRPKWFFREIYEFIKSKRDDQ